MKTLREAAQAVVERWDAPLWRDIPATAQYIADLRKALEAPEQEPDLYRSYIAVCEELVKRTEDRDALLAAGKLAVDALDDWYYGANQDRPKAAVYVAFQALKAAGVS